jgi:hypothetical protein
MANLVHKDIEVEDWGMATFTFCQRPGRDARGVVDDQRPAENRPVAEAEQRRAPRSGGHARRNHRSVVPRAGRAVLAAGASDWVFERQSEEPFAPRRLSR